jgi:uncharacterized membrane protein
LADEADVTPSVLPIHIEETIQSIVRLHGDHHANSTRHQRVVETITSVLRRPLFITILTVFVVAWIGVNAFAPALGYRPLDGAPFPWLSGGASLASLYLVVLILTTQRRDDQLTRRRELLNLELAILSEQKTTKVIALLEELRRDSPLVRNRVDEQADIMARPADPQSVNDAINETRSEAAHISRIGNGA